MRMPRLWVAHVVSEVHHCGCRGCGIHTAAEAVVVVVVAVECDSSSSNISSGIGSSRGIISCIIRSTRGGSSRV